MPDYLIYFSLSLLAFFALSIKLLVVANIRFKSAEAISFLSLCILFVITNFFELLGNITNVWAPDFTGTCLRLYMMAIYFLPPTMVGLAVSKSARTNGTIILYILPFFLISVFFLWMDFQGQVIVGHKFTSYTVITVGGPLYPLMSVYMVTSFVFALITLYLGWTRSENEVVRLRCGNALIATGPMTVLFIAVLTLRNYEFESSSAVVIPVLASFFLFFMLINNNDSVYLIKVKLRIFKLLLFQGKKIHNKNLLAKSVKNCLYSVAVKEQDTGLRAGNLLGVSRSSVSRWKQKEEEAHGGIVDPESPPTTWLIRFRLLFTIVFNKEVALLKSHMEMINRIFIIYSKKQVGTRQRDIAKTLNMGQSTVSKHISKYLQGEGRENLKKEVFQDEN